MPVLISMEAVLRAVIQATQEKHVKSVSMQKEVVSFIAFFLNSKKIISFCVFFNLLI